MEKAVNRKAFTKALKTGAIVILTVFIAFNLLTAILSGLDLRDRLHWMPCSFLSVTTGSMEPDISAGDVIFVWETPYEDLLPGDIITFHYGEEFITHRIERRDGSRFITRGTANTFEDERTVGPEEYCAKLVFTIPGAGRVLDFFSQPGTAFLGISFIAGIFLAVSLVRRNSGKRSGNSDEKAVRRQPAAVPALVLMFVASIFAVSPYMTSAKYIAKINEYTTIFAEPNYFTSNFLTREGSSYSIKGWDGGHYLISLSVRNYENSLLFNKTGRDDIYAIAVEKVSSNGSDSYLDGSCYSVSVTPSSNVQLYDGTSGSFTGDWNRFKSPDEFSSMQCLGPYLIMGSDDKALGNEFSVEVGAAEGYSFTSGEKICFKLCAFTSPSQGYYQRLEGTFVFEVAGSQSFLGAPVLQQEKGNLLVNYSVTTNLLSGDATQLVEFNWDPDVLYINEYQPTVFNIINNPLTKNDYDRGIRSEDSGTAVPGSLKMNLQAFSSIKLQFFKYKPDDISYSAIDVHIVTGGAISFPDE